MSGNLAVHKIYVLVFWSEDSGDVESSLAKAHSLISEAKAEAAQIRESAVTKAKETASKELEAAQRTIEEKYEAFLQELQGERSKLKTELVSNLSTYQNSLQTKLKNI